MRCQAGIPPEPSRRGWNLPCQRSDLHATHGPLQAKAEVSLSLPLTHGCFSHGTHLLFKKKPRPALRVSADSWYSRVPSEPPEPPQPPAPPAPPAPLVPPAPPAPPTPPIPPAPENLGNRTVLKLVLPSAFDELLSEPESNKLANELIEAPGPAPHWGTLEAYTWDESAVGTNGDVAADDEHRGGDDMDAEADTEAEAGAKAGTEAGTEADVFPEG
ncbi:unnamed protein product, partial [Closterium sp. NIES-54]